MATTGEDAQHATPQAVGATRSHARTSSPTGTTGTVGEEHTLTDPRWANWLADGRSEEELAKYLKTHLADPFTLILDEFFDSADKCVERDGALRDQHELWRRIVIGVTGGVAILNALSALAASRRPDGVDPIIALSLAGLAAIAAAVLAMLANLENFGNYLERGQAYREAREVYLDAYREFARLWQVHVLSIGYRPEALMNAAELYRMICVRDSELRRKLNALTQRSKK